MDKKSVRLIQRKLQAMGHYHGAIDGDRGPLTNAAVVLGLGDIAGNKPAGLMGWSNKRKAIAFLQLYCHAEGIDAGIVDGWWGPQTDFAAEALAELIETGAVHPWRDTVHVTPGNPNGWPAQGNVTAFYGPHGAPNFGPTPPPVLETVPCPWPLKLAWDRSRRRSGFRVHEKVAQSLGRVSAQIDAAYTQDQKEDLGLHLFGGDYFPRKIRGGTSWSMHSWGIAIDFDPERNQLHWGRDRARLAQPDATPFWQAWEAEGWISLGREKNFDWMHVQAARLN
jgi:hypothetical protein